MGAEGPAASQDDNILYLGLDLGTSQSSICTSTDLRRTVTSPEISVLCDSHRCVVE